MVIVIWSLIGIWGLDIGIFDMTLVIGHSLFSASRCPQSLSSSVKLTSPHPSRLMKNRAGVAELADAQDLGSCTERCRGSTPLSCTWPHQATERIIGAK